MIIKQLRNKTEIPYDLLLSADPSIIHINKYLQNGSCYIMKLKTTIVGVLVLSESNSTSLEIKNIAIKDKYQGNGYGKQLLNYAIQIAQNSQYKKLIIGTGNTSTRQISIYQNAGFKISSIIKNFFIDKYDKPIFENNTQCKHMVILEMNV